MFEVARKGAPERVTAPYEHGVRVVVVVLDESRSLGMLCEARGILHVSLNTAPRPIANK